LAAIDKDDERKKIRYSFGTTLVKIVSYMQTRLPLSYPVLRDLQCLHPLARKTDEGKRAFTRLCMHLHNVTKTDGLCDKVQAEWLIYMCDTDNTVEQWSAKHLNECSGICGYWNYVTHLSNVAEQSYDDWSLSDLEQEPPLPLPSNDRACSATEDVIELSFDDWSLSDVTEQSDDWSLSDLEQEPPLPSPSNDRGDVTVTKDSRQKKRR
jgi:hypothetical protein